MNSPNRESPADIEGLEYDWLGCDSRGSLALFSTAGAGYAPIEFLRNVDKHSEAIAALLNLPPSTEAQFAPSVAPGRVNTWKLAAERGLYAYDCDPNGGPYQLVAAPVVPSHVDTLPQLIVTVAVKIERLRFEDSAAIREDMLGGPR